MTVKVKLRTPKGPEAKRRAAKRAASEREKKRVYALVDQRDDFKCRFTRASNWLEHHHIVKRSQGGKHETSNAVLISKELHFDIHHGLIAIEGNADETLWLVDLISERRWASPVPMQRVA